MLNINKYNKTIVLGELKTGEHVEVTLNIEKVNKPATTTTHHEVNSYYKVSFVGDIKDGYRSNTSGQIIDDISGDVWKQYRSGRDAIIEAWKVYHLNNMNPNCAHQTRFNTNVDNYRELADAETARCPHGYIYGSSWLVKLIPDSAIENLIKVFDTFSEPAGLDYYTSPDGLKGKLNLKMFGAANIDLHIEYKDEVVNSYDNGKYKNYTYTVTLKDRTNRRQTSFIFNSSINDYKHGKIKIDEGLINSILSCIAIDFSPPDSFDEFCSEYGYNNDSREHLALYNKCRRQAQKINNILGADFDFSKLPD